LEQPAYSPGLPSKDYYPLEELTLNLCCHKFKGGNTCDRQLITQQKEFYQQGIRKHVPSDDNTSIVTGTAWESSGMVVQLTLLLLLNNSITPLNRVFLDKLEVLS
jgi:hypothetical protein